LAFSIGDRARLAGYRVSSFETLGSTNAEALEAAANGDPGRHWFATKEQTAGRGRRGRVWFTQKGNLAASLLLVFDQQGGNHSSLGFVAGVALVEALALLAPGAPVALKWPNDALVAGRKLSGILLDMKPLPGGREAIAVGIGVNVVAAPGDMPFPATSLAGAGFVLNAEEVFEALTDTFAETFTIWSNGHGLGDVLALWKRYAAGIGGPISVTTPKGTLSGTFEALDAKGRLLVRTDGGALKTVSAGDVYFGTAASGDAS